MPAKENREAATLSMVQKLQPSQPPRQYTFRLENRADLPTPVEQLTAHFDLSWQLRWHCLMHQDCARLEALLQSMLRLEALLQSMLHLHLSLEALLQSMLRLRNCLFHERISLFYH